MQFIGVVALEQDRGLPKAGIASFGLASKGVSVCRILCTIQTLIRNTFLPNWKCIPSH